MNLVAIAQFFYIICITIMDHVIIFGRQDDLLGPIFYYYGIVETNNSGILQLHCILWLSKNLSFPDIKTRLLEDKIYASQIIIYLNTIISSCVDEAILWISTMSSNQYINLFTGRYKSNSDWLESIHHDSNAIAAIKQMHRSSHNVICFKYTHEKNRQCRFDFPCQIIDTSFVGQHGVIKLKKNNY